MEGPRSAAAPGGGAPVFRPRERLPSGPDVCFSSDLLACGLISTRPVRSLILAAMRARRARTREPGFKNPKKQVVLRNTDRQGTDLHQFVDVLRCEKCGHEYGSNGSNNHNRKCPNCQGGKPGLPFD